MCPLVGGMKKQEDWCPQGTERLIAVAEVHLDNTCAMFRPLDLARLDGGNHPLAVRRAAEKLKAKRVDRKSNAAVRGGRKAGVPCTGVVGISGSET